MKVALVCYFHPFSGIGKYPFNLFSVFRRQKKPVDMVYLETRHNRIEERQGILKVKKDMKLIEINKTLLPYFYFPLKIPEGYGVYHATNQYLSRVALYRTPCVITHHDIRPIALAHDIKMRLVGLTLRYLLKFYRRAKEIIAISNEAKQSLLDLKIVPKEKIHVVYHGYDDMIYRPVKKSVARKKLGLPQDAKIVLNIGTEDPMRRVSLILEAMKEIQKSEPDAMLVRVGGSMQSGGYWQANEKLKREVNLKQMKNIPEEEMPYIYSAADVFVAPQAYNEGFSYPPLEAMACGTPLMISNMKIFEKWAAPISNNPRVLSENILKILNNSTLSQKLSKKSLRGAKHFSLEKEAQKTYEVYEMASKQ